MRLQELTDAQIEALTDEEWEELHDLSPEYLFAADFLSRRELGLAPGRDELTARQEQVILFVASQRQRLTRGGPQQRDPQRRSFEQEADPEELDMSDEQLLAVGRGRG